MRSNKNMLLLALEGNISFKFYWSYKDSIYKIKVCLIQGITLKTLKARIKLQPVELQEFIQMDKK